MYRTLNQHYRETFGCKVYKLSIDGGFSCPNRDGTCGTGGCIFCDGSGAFAERGNSIRKQLEQAKRRVEAKNPGGRYISYFQAFTNTYAPVEHLRKAYLEDGMTADQFITFGSSNRTTDQFINDGWNPLSAFRYEQD